MEIWNKLDRTHIPTMEMISKYVSNPRWYELCNYLEEQFNVKPVLEYSGCSVPGWNVKYRKAGRSLCTLYPMEGYFITLIVIGTREKDEFEKSIHLFSTYMQDLYQNTKEGMGQKWLMIEVEDDDILDDVKRCITIRRGLKRKE